MESDRGRTRRKATNTQELVQSARSYSNQNLLEPFLDCNCKFVNFHLYFSTILFFLKILSNKRNPIYEVMEQILISYVEDCAKHSDPLCQWQIQTEARELVRSIELQYYSGNQHLVSNFVASDGWFRRFCDRHQVKHVKFYGESALVNKNVVIDFVSQFEVIANGYHPHLIFNFDECGLFWRKMPTGGYTTSSIPTVPGHKPNKVRVTLLVGKCFYLF